MAEQTSKADRVKLNRELAQMLKGGVIMDVTRSQMAQGITIATQGYRLGEYREGDQFMPILLKDIGRTTLYSKLEEYGLKYKFKQS